MTWLAPLNLLWLLAFLPPLILLYFLKIKRQPHVIPSIMLWHKSLHDLHANAPFQRLRRNLLLFLQIIIFLLLAAALARPIMRGSAFAGKRIILLIDRSASMKTVDMDGTSRFERALEIAHSVAEDPDKREMMVISFANRASVETPFTSSSMEVKRALKRLECTDTTTEIEDALRIAASAAKGKDDVHVVILSDGAVGNLKKIQERNFTLDFIGLGERCFNTAITGVSVRRALEDDASGIHLFVEVSNFSEQMWAVSTEILHEGALVAVEQWDMEPGGVTGRTFDLPEILEGLVEIRLDGSDDLASDDRAAVVVLPPRAPSILLLSAGNVFLKNALEAIPGVEVTVGSAEASDDESGFDIAVYDGVNVPLDRPARAVLALGTVPPGLGVEEVGEMESALFGDGDWDETHPVNRYADYSSLFVKKALEVTLPEHSPILLESKGGPLMASFEKPGEKTLCVFFDIRDSDWPFHISFPVFLSNAIHWLYGGGDQGVEGAWHRTGQPLTLPPGGGRMELPGGGSVSVVDEGKGLPSFSATEESGVYTYENRGGGTLRFALNLASARESKVKPEKGLDIPGERVEARPSEEVIFREYWHWLILGLIGFLLLEWWIYHRRAV
ncbi:MAG: vWA domain-containing protein [Planctomycetota bacterium]|jgi:hypothetical protein